MQRNGFLKNIESSNSTVWYCSKDGHKDQWQRREMLDIHGHMFYAKCDTNKHGGWEGQSFQWLVLGQLDIDIEKKEKGIWSLPRNICNINFRGIVDLNIKGKTAKLVESNIWECLYDLGMVERFFNMPQKVLAIKMIDKIDYIKI